MVYHTSRMNFRIFVDIFHFLLFSIGFEKCWFTLPFSYCDFMVMGRFVVKKVDMWKDSSCIYSKN